MVAGLATASLADEIEDQRRLSIHAALPDLKAGNLDKVVQRFDAILAYVEDDKLDYVLQRSLFSLFETTDPTVLALSDRWIAEQPDSPAAHTARGWTLMHRSVLMRGDRPAAETYPEALQQAAALAAEAMAEAVKAHDAAPDLVSASDLMINAGMMARSPVGVEDLVGQVMARTPNRGTLHRAANALAPRWGGSLDQVFALCDAYAEKIAQVPGYGADVCKADLLQEANFSEAERQSQADTVAASDHPVLAAARIAAGMAQRDTSPEFQRELETYLFDINVTDTGAAAYLDVTFYEPQKRPLISYDVTMRKIADAWDRLDRDPANYYVQRDVLTESVGNRPILPRLGKATRFQHLQQALAFSPFNADLWYQIGWVTGAEGREALAIRSRATEKAIFYSNQSEHFLGGHAQSLAGDYALYLLVRDSKDSFFLGEPVGSYTSAAEDLLCPFARAARLYAAMCEAGAADPDSCGQLIGSVDWQTALAAAQAENQCAPVFSADLGVLAYADQPLDPADLSPPAD